MMSTKKQPKVVFWMMDVLFGKIVMTRNVNPQHSKTKNVLDVIDFQYVWGYVLVITCQVSVIANMKLWTKILRLVY